MSLTDKVKKLILSLSEEDVVEALKQCAEESLTDEDKQIFLVAIDIFSGEAIYDKENDQVAYPLF